MCKKSCIDLAKFLSLSLLLLGAVFFLPDAGQQQRGSFFIVALQSPWSRPFDWDAVWCSAKIIGLSLSGLLIIDGFLKVALRVGSQIVCRTLFVLTVFPFSLGLFGFYELVKALL